MKLGQILTAVAMAHGFAALAQTVPASGVEPSAHPSATAAAPQSDGEVRKVDREQGKITLRHGPLQNLDMPAMTMVFKAADPMMLDGIKEGDRVRFTAEKVNGVFTVTALQPSK